MMTVLVKVEAMVKVVLAVKPMVTLEVEMVVIMVMAELGVEEQPLVDRNLLGIGQVELILIIKK